MNKYSVLIIFVLGLGFAWADWLAVAQCDAEDRTMSYITKYPKITMMNGNCAGPMPGGKFEQMFIKINSTDGVGFYYQCSDKECNNCFLYWKPKLNTNNKGKLCADFSGDKHIPSNFIIQTPSLAGLVPRGAENLNWIKRTGYRQKCNGTELAIEYIPPVFCDLYPEDCYCTECVAEDKFNLATTDYHCPNNIQSWEEKSFPGCELNYLGAYQYSVASKCINY
jgi:hypothetical protein